MSKLLVLPGNCDTLGGTLITLSLLKIGFENHNMSERLSILIRADSLMDRYLQASGQSFCFQKISSSNQAQFFKQAIQWVNQQPKDYPLLLDNCVYNYLLPTFLINAPRLRCSGRRIYHFCHDLAHSNTALGFIARKLIFTCVSPRVLCNSRFTAAHVHRLMPNIQGILYQPVNLKRFNDSPPMTPPKELLPILQSGYRIILTPSRITEPGLHNDKNLRSLIPVLAHLKAMGYHYHGVVIGEDKSQDQLNSRTLLESADKLGVAKCFTILAPTLTIEDYYKYANVVVTLAPREPFGRTVVEAIACGVPVIGSRTGGIGEILGHFAPQWMVDPNDPVAVARAIVQVSIGADTPKLIAKGKSWVESQCSVMGYTRKIIELTELVDSTDKLLQSQKDLKNTASEGKAKVF
ncbi:MAG: glycosyltransferase family 4 protein [Scytonema sp. PMC 1069.18]|nr:glycosyltransferase family 4 protein [Scytonema sp. PMC 1069.18]MEC4887304.1 glycosyltransferase family 4 protein [Scytonema sp. PMC 1070.18]